MYYILFSFHNSNPDVRYTFETLTNICAAVWCNFNMTYHYT